jgi:hypothetical protein
MEFYNNGNLEVKNSGKLRGFRAEDVRYLISRRNQRISQSFVVEMLSGERPSAFDSSEMSYVLPTFRERTR